MSDIDIQFATKKNCPSSSQIKKWIAATLTEQKRNGSLVVRIVDENEMKTLNHQFRNIDKPTNVLSFSCQLPPNLRGDILGDIVICAPVVALEAQEQNKSLTSHWAHMVVHGVLHLLGHDHEKDDEAD